MEYSADSIQVDQLTTCCKALIGIIEPEDIWLSNPISFKAQFHGKKEVLKSLESTTSISSPGLSLIFITVDKLELRVSFIIRYRLLVLNIEGAESTLEQKLIDVIEQILGLKEPSELDMRSDAKLPNIYKLVWDVWDNIQIIKQEIAKILTSVEDDSSKKFKCFVSFRFDDHSKALALELRDFLEKVNMDFVSGLGFEPRSVSKKVLDRLNSPLDLFIIIFTSSGDSAWLNQEVGVAKGRNLPIIVLVEEGTDWDKGLLGDIEYIEFPKGIISKTFIRLLEGVDFIKNQNIRA